MSKFKVGDKVRCIDITNSSILELNKEYEISDLNVKYLYLTDDPDAGYYHNRFELVCKEEHTSELKPNAVNLTKSGQPILEFLEVQRQYLSGARVEEYSEGKWYINDSGIDLQPSMYKYRVYDDSHEVSFKSKLKNSKCNVYIKDLKLVKYFDKEVLVPKSVNFLCLVKEKDEIYLGGFEDQCTYLNSTLGCQQYASPKGYAMKKYLFADTAEFTNEEIRESLVKITKV